MRFEQEATTFLVCGWFHICLFGGSGFGGFVLGIRFGLGIRLGVRVRDEVRVKDKVWGSG